MSGSKFTIQHNVADYHDEYCDNAADYLNDLP